MSFLLPLDDLLDLTSKYNKCYCADCHSKRSESNYHREGSGSHNIYTKPLGWGRVMLQLPPRAKSLKIFPDWNVAYHGTTTKSVVPILNSGMLLIPGNFYYHTVDIKVSLSIHYHFDHGRTSSSSSSYLQIPITSIICDPPLEKRVLRCILVPLQEELAQCASIGL